MRNAEDDHARRAVQVVARQGLPRDLIGTAAERREADHELGRRRSDAVGRMEHDGQSGRGVVCPRAVHDIDDRRGEHDRLTEVQHELGRRARKHLTVRRAAADQERVRLGCRDGSDEGGDAEDDENERQSTDRPSASNSHQSTGTWRRCKVPTSIEIGLPGRMAPPVFS